MTWWQIALLVAVAVVACLVGMRVGVYCFLRAFFDPNCWRTNAAPRRQRRWWWCVAAFLACASFATAPALATTWHVRIDERKPTDRVVRPFGDRPTVLVWIGPVMRECEVLPRSTQWSFQLRDEAGDVFWMPRHKIAEPLRR